MISLNQFYEVIEIAGQTPDPNHKAYRMDNGQGKPDMRRYLDLGTCHTCDYFFISNGSIVLIEEKQLADKMKGIEQEFFYLNKDHKESFALKTILQNLRLKVYGSLLMLSRLTLQCKEFAHLVEGGTRHDFWFVASGSEEKDMRYFDHIKNRLLRDLRSLFTKNFIGDVAVIRPQELQQKLNSATHS